MKSLLAKITVLFLTTSLLTGCYEDYLLVTSNYESAVISSDSTTVYFFHFLSAKQPPKGISRLPDGGTYKTIYENVKLCSYQLQTGELKNIRDFGTPQFHQVLNHIGVQNDDIVFSLSPLMGWNWIKDHNSDSTYKKVLQKYAGFYKYNISDNSLNRFVNDGFYPQLSPDSKQIVYLKRDTAGLSIWHLNIHEDINQELISLNIDSPFKPIIWKDNTSIYYKTEDGINQLNITDKTTQPINSDVEFYPYKIPISKIKQITSDITFQQWGFNLREHFKKTTREYIDDIVLLNGNLSYRKAIIEVISKEISNDDINKMLKRMQEHQNTLQGVEKMKYEFNSKETKDELKKLLE